MKLNRIQIFALAALAAVLGLGGYRIVVIGQARSDYERLISEWANERTLRLHDIAGHVAKFRDAFGRNPDSNDELAAYSPESAQLFAPPRDALSPYEIRRDGIVIRGRAVLIDDPGYDLSRAEIKSIERRAQIGALRPPRIVLFADGSVDAVY